MKQDREQQNGNREVEQEGGKERRDRKKLRNGQQAYVSIWIFGVVSDFGEMKWIHTGRVSSNPEALWTSKTPLGPLDCDT